MEVSDCSSKWVFSVLFLLCSSLTVVNGICELSVRGSNEIYNFSLVAPSKKYPHGVLSEDGFYTVLANETRLWFQLCDRMIFNHNPPVCFECQGCGGPLHCGMMCSALVENIVEGYHVCTTIGQASTSNITLLDEKDPSKGVIVKMYSISPMKNCSLSVTVLCDSNGVIGPHSLVRLGDSSCDYVAELRHPSGCAKIISFHGRGWGWLGTLLTILLCSFGAYFLAGIVYRFFFLRIRGIEIVPNLDFWMNLPQRAQSLLGSFIQRIRNRTRSHHRASYSAVNF